MVWSNDVGWIHVGTEADFHTPQTKGGEIWGGTSSAPLKRTAMLGGKKFSTEKAALQALAHALPVVDELVQLLLEETE